MVLCVTDEPATKVENYTDGACKGNPGPGGWGAVIRMGAHEKELAGGELLTTNNRMEMTAAIEALNILTRPCIVHYPINWRSDKASSAARHSASGRMISSTLLSLRPSAPPG